MIKIVELLLYGLIWLLGSVIVLGLTYLIVMLFVIEPIAAIFCTIIFLFSCLMPIKMFSEIDKDIKNDY